MYYPIEEDRSMLYKNGLKGQQQTAQGIPCRNGLKGQQQTAQGIPCRNGLKGQQLTAQGILISNLTRSMYYPIEEDRSMLYKNGLKGQQLTAQGIALGRRSRGKRPVRAKALVELIGFCPFRAFFTLHISPGRCPGLIAIGLSGRPADM
jgi:hypothetical protein